MNLTNTRTPAAMVIGTMLAAGSVSYGQALQHPSTQPNASGGNIQDVSGQGITPDERSNPDARTEMPSKMVLNKANEVIGRDVMNAQDEKLGHIRELAIEGRTGRVAYAVLEFDRLGDLRDKLFAIPWQALNPKTDTEKWFNQKVFILDVPKEKLATAPGFDRNKWLDMANRQWGTQVHEFYGQKPYWQHQRSGKRDHGADVDVNVTPNGADVQARTDRDATTPDREADRRVDNLTTPPTPRDDMDRSMAERGPRMILKANEQLIGQDITNQEDKDIGDVENLLIDRRTGKVALVIAELDGFDRGKELAALPWTSVVWKWDEAAKEGTVGLKLPLDQIKAHAFAKDQWPDFQNRTELTDLYRAYNARPFWIERESSDVLGFQE